MTKFELGALAMREAIAKMADHYAKYERSKHEQHNHDAEWVVIARAREKAFLEFAAEVRSALTPEMLAPKSSDGD